MRLVVANLGNGLSGFVEVTEGRWMPSSRPSDEPCCVCGVTSWIQFWYCNAWQSFCTAHGTHHFDVKLGLIDD